MSISTPFVLVAVGALAVASVTAIPSASSGAPASSVASTRSSSCPPVTYGVLNSAPLVRGSAKTVALTFDDGPGRSTRAIIKILRSFHVRATFFNIGWSIHSFPSDVKMEATDGFLLGDHTNSHPDMKTLSRSAQASEVVQVMVDQHELTATMPCVFRPPYGDFNAITRSVVNEHGMSLWMWSGSGDDWQADGSDSTYWIHRIESSVINGSRGVSHPVVLLHNQMIAMPATVAALPDIIRSFKRRGYTFVDLLGRTGPPGVCGNPAAAPFVASYTTIPNGTVLAGGSTEYSPNGQFVLTMDHDGQLTYAEVGGATLWSTPTGASPGAVATIDNGALSVTSAGGQTLWSTGSTDADELRLESNGSLALVGATGSRWNTGHTLTTMQAGSSLRPGWYVSSPNGRCELTMTTSGALRLVTADHQTFWWNDTRTTGARTVLRPTGSLVTVSSTGEVAWSSGTSTGRRDVVSVTNAGTVTISRATGGVIWATQ